MGGIFALQDDIFSWSRMSPAFRPRQKCTCGRCSTSLRSRGLRPRTWCCQTITGLYEHRTRGLIRFGSRRMLDYCPLSRGKDGSIALFSQAPFFVRDRHEITMRDFLVRRSATSLQLLRGGVATVDCHEHGRESGLRSREKLNSCLARLRVILFPLSVAD